MSKRSADNQLTKDEYEAQQDEETLEQNESGTWKSASEEKLKTRQIVKARRTGATTTTNNEPAAPALPKFSFASSTIATPAPAADVQTTTQTVTTEAPVAAAPRTLADLLAAQASQGWECPTCEVRNKFTLAKCAACDTARPAEFDEQGGAPKAEEKKDDAPKFTFGVPASTASAPAANGANSAPAFANTFSFGSSTNSATPFTFGKPITGESAGSLFNPFASVAAASTDASKATFTFGSSSDKSNLASFQSVASTSETKSDFTGSDAPQFPSTASLEASAGPNEEFKGKQAESSGEEKDEIQHRQQCKVFTMKVVADAVADDKADDAKSSTASTAQPQPKWVEIGSGELHVNIYVGSNEKRMARLIMRTDKTHRLVLNTPLVPSLAHSFTLQGDKYVKIASIDPETTNLVQYLFKVGTKQDAKTLLEQFTAVTSKITE